MKNHPTYSYHCAWVAPRISRWMLIVLLSLTSTVVSQAQVEVFMRVFPRGGGNALAGDSDDLVYKSTDGWCRAKSFTLGAEITYEAGSGGGGVPIRRLGSIALDLGKEVSAISPLIFMATAKGAHFETMEIAVRKRGTRSGEAYLKYEFRLAAPSRQTWAGSEDETKETIRFDYAALRMTVRSQSLTGGLAGSPGCDSLGFPSQQGRLR